MVLSPINWVPPPACLLDNGYFRFTFSGATNANYFVFGATNLALQLCSWDLLGPPIYLGDGYYQYLDTQATNSLNAFIAQCNNEQACNLAGATPARHTQNGPIGQRKKPGSKTMKTRFPNRTAALAFGALLVLTFSRAPLSAQCVVPPAGLLAWWTGNGNANDSAGTNNGTLMNGATFAPGLVGQAFHLDGAGAFVEIPDAPSLNPSNQITVTVWWNSVAFGGGCGNNAIVNKPYVVHSPPYYQYHLGVDGADGSFTFWVAAGGSAAIADTGSGVGFLASGIIWLAPMMAAR